MAASGRFVRLVNTLKKSETLLLDGIDGFGGEAILTNSILILFIVQTWLLRSV